MVDLDEITKAAHAPSHLGPLTDDPTKRPMAWCVAMSRLTGRKFVFGDPCPLDADDDGPCAEALIALYLGLDNEVADEVTGRTLDLRGCGLFVCGLGGG